MRSVAAAAVLLMSAVTATAAVTGAVVSPDGTPVAGARVEARLPWQPQTTAQKAERKLLGAATTGSDGRFSIDLAGYGVVVLHIAKEGAAALEVPAPMRGAAGTFVLRPRTTYAAEPIDADFFAEPPQPRGRFAVTGVVRDADKHPLAGVSMLLMPSGEVHNRPFIGSAVTAMDGSFRFDAPRGHYELSAHGTFYATVEEEVEVSSAVAHDMVLRPATPIAGTVMGSDGKPAAYAAIFVLVREPKTGQTIVAPTPYVTAADGTFALYADQEPGDSHVVAIRRGEPPAISDTIDAKRKPLTLKIEKGAPVTGVVADARGKPLTGVAVVPVIGQMPVDVSYWPWPAGWATTDAAGRFAGAVTSATGALSFEKHGFVAKQQVIAVRDGMAPLQIQLADAAVVTGRAIDSDGAPAADVAVHAGQRFAITAADGTFRIEDLVPGPQQIQFGRNGWYGQQAVTAPASDVKLVVASLRTIRGRVIDGEGHPIGEFTVSAAVDPADSEISMPGASGGANGEFTLTAPRTVRKVRVEAPGFLGGNVPIDPAADKPLLITLSRGLAARGRVVDEAGQPLGGVTVTADNGEEGGDGVETAADGTYELSGLTHSSAVRFRKESYVPVERKIAGGEGDVIVDVTLQRGLSVSGRVVDGAGNGIGGVSVRAESAAYGVQAENAQSDENGAFHFDGLAAARYDFAIENEDGRSGAVRDVDVAKVHEVTIRVEKSPTGTIFGKVAGADASAVMRMVMVTSESGPMATGQIDAEGKYRIENAPAGAVEVRAMTYSQSGTRNTKSLPMEIAPGRETEVNLTFVTPVEVHGRVTRGGAAVAGATISFGSDGVAKTTAEGTYATSIEPGEYDVSLASAEGTTIPFSQHVSIAAPSQLDFKVEALTVAARVVDQATGQPLSGAKVSASHHGQTHTLTTATTGADGVASLDVMAGSEVTIGASMTGYANASVDVTPSDNQAVTLRLPPSAGAKVRIVDQRDGRTLTGYVIARDSGGRVVASSTESDPDGTTTLPLAAGRWSFSASAEGYGSATIAGEIPADEIRIPLPRGGSLSLRATRDLRGSARLIQADGQEYVRCWCSGIAAIEIEGRTTLVDRISPGSYTLELTLANEKARRIPVTVVEGETRIVPIE